MRKYEEQDRTNDKCQVRAMQQEKDSHKIKEKQQCHKVALGSNQTSKVSKGKKSTRKKNLNLQE